MTTKYGLPIIKLPGGEQIQPGRVVRFRAGVAGIVGLLAGWIEAHGTVELGMWIGLALLLIDPTLFATAMRAYRNGKNGK